LDAPGPLAVLDSSVLVPRWSRIVLQRLAEAGRFRPVWSEWIVAETWRVLTRKRVEDAARQSKTVDWDRLERDADLMLRILLPVMSTQSLAGPAPYPPAWPGHPDPNDLPIWATAKLAGAAYVVSHDLRQFPPLVDGRHIYDRIEYLTAIELIEDVLGADATATYRGPLPPAGVLRSRRSPEQEAERAS
jgi:hypothetical protein